MNKLEIIIANVLEEIKPKHTKDTFENRRHSLNRLLRFANEHGFDEPCQELYDAFTANDKGSVDVRFNLTHAVRLVDLMAETHAKDNNGKLYNEPSLPPADKAAQYFIDKSFPISEGTDLNCLIVFSEQILRRYSLSKSTVGQYKHAWIDLRRYCLDRSVTTYCKEIILGFVDDSRSQYDQRTMQPWKWKINRKAVSVLIEVAETGTFVWKQFPYRDLSCGDIELDNIRDQYVESLRSRNLEQATVNLHEYVFRFGMKHGGIRDFLGHSSIETTTIYSHADDEMIASALAAIDHEPQTDECRSCSKEWKGKEEYLLQYCGLI